MVPLALCAALESIGHDVIRTVVRLGPGKPDSEVVALAEAERAIVVTWNRRHFEPLTRNKATGHAGAPYFDKVNYADAATRLLAVSDVLHYEIGRGVRTFLIAGGLYVQVWR